MVIDKNKIEEAAKRYVSECHKPFDTERGFNQGAQFAQNELKPLFCEFAEWFFITTDKFTRPNLYSVVEWADIDCSKLYTTEQLFELWLEQRSKK